MRISDSVSDYARNMARDCHIDSTCAFISDKTTSDTRLYYLGNFGVSEEVLSLYQQHRICDSDPFTDVQKGERTSAGDAAGFCVVDHPDVARGARRAKDYWQFVSEQNIEVVGAATLRLQSRLYLTIGAHRSRKRTRCPPVPVERLGHRIEILQNKIATHLLSSLLDGGKGYRSLLDVLVPDIERLLPAPANLSSRETEIARLVCEGKQNKEIAFAASLSEYTVENHLRRIYQKLAIHNRAALVARMNGVLV